MKFGRRAAAISLVLFLLTAATGLMGCADSVSTTGIPPEQEPLKGEASQFFGGLLKQVLSGVLSGATGEIGSEAMGLVLSLLGWGQSTDQPALDSMSGKLDRIVSILGDIKKDLDALMQQLKITEGEILSNTNDPSDAITAIKQAHSELQGLSGSKAGTVDKSVLGTFTNRVENTHDVYTQVMAVHDSIIPSTVAKVPVLKNFRDLSINKGNSLTDTYLGVEKYFSQLLYYQMEGVNLIIETKKYREKAGLPQIDGRDAKAYMDYFTSQMLVPEVDDFMENIHSMLLNNADLLNSDSFLPSEASDILKRANFFRLHAFNQDHFGLRATLLATQDLVSLVPQLEAIGVGRFDGKGELSSLTNRTYDFWSQTKVKGNSAYEIVGYDFGDTPSGRYQVFEIVGSSQNLLGAPDVNMYNDDYTIPSDGSGKINYGHITLAKRVGARDAFSRNPVWNLTWITDGNTTVWGRKTDNKMVRLATNTRARNYSAQAQLDATFQFLAAAPSTIQYSMNITGETSSYVYSATGDSDSSIHYRIGLIDGTTGAIVHEFESKTAEASASNYQADHTRVVTEKISKQLTDKFLFNNPSPGHSYYVFFFIKIEGKRGTGTADSEGWIEIKDIDVYLTF